VILSRRQVGPTGRNLPLPRARTGLHQEIDPAARFRRVWLAPQVATLLNRSHGLAELPNPNFGTDPSPSRAAAAAKKNEICRRG
jgi:hypothetical protein